MKEHEFHEHFPNVDEIDLDLYHYITNQVMSSSRYLFTHREGRRQWAYCTHCQNEHPTEQTYRHGQEETCPHCSTVGMVKASGIGRKRLIDNAYLLWYERSLVDSNILIARGFYSTRDYTKDYRKTETEVKEISRYLFKWGEGSLMMHRSYWTNSSKWYEQKKITSEAIRAMKYTESYHMPPDEIAKVVKGTPFQYCTWERYCMRDYVEIFDLAASYPCIEFLTKFGFEHVVRSKLEGGPTYGAINWNGKTPQKVLRMSKTEIKDLQAAGLIGLRVLKYYQNSRRDGTNFTFEESKVLADLIEPNNQAEFQRLLSQSLEDRFKDAEIKRYLLKQIRNNPRQYRSASSVIIEYRDYLRECRELGLDLSRPGIVMPNNLHLMHQDTMHRIKINTDREIQQRLHGRAQKLKEMRFQYGGFILFPAPSVDQLVREGKELSHCVGGYTKNYANGVCDIYFIRSKENPDKPFYTMEIRKGEIIQCRGFKNCDKTPEVEEFVKQFEKQVLNKRQTSKVKKSKELQGVAV